MLLAALALPLPSHAAPPRLDDYAYGIAIPTQPGLPLVELQLPDDVYQRVTRDDLGDVRVFNTDGNAVPHAFCTAADRTAASVSDQALSVFALRASQAAAGTGSRIEVRTATGTQVNVQEPGGGEAPAKPSVHVIDARGVEGVIRSLTFDWESPDGASEATVAIQASEDLDRWTTLVSATRLLEVSREGEVLRRARVGLPQGSYSYVRVERIDTGPALVLHAATAERVAAGADIEPLWFIAEPQARTDPTSLAFDAARRAPVRYARILLSPDNSAVRASIESRPDEKATWRQRWSGEVYAIVVENERRVSPPARFETTTDRYWRIRLPPDAALPEQPRLELGYRPLRLRFLAQGAGPYTVAFGSRRAEPATAINCDGLLADLRGTERDQLIGEAYPVGGARVLGGEVALKPPPKETPTRVIVLWSVLVVGVGLVVAMALTLLKRVRPEE